MNAKHLRVLLVEDNPADARLVRVMLAESGTNGHTGEFDVHAVARVSEALARLAGGDWHIVLLDLSLPDARGLEALYQLRAAAPDLPIVIMSGLADEKIAVQAVQEGAQDYLVKGTVEGALLTRAIRYAIERQRAEETLRQSQQKFSIIFEKAAFTASLSLLPDDVIVDINEAFEKTFGYTRLEVLGKTSLELGLNPDVEGRARLLTALKEHGSMRNLELSLRTKSGEARFFLVNMDLVDIGDQKHILTTTQDITERKQTEQTLAAKTEELRAMTQQLWQTAKLATMGELAASIAHELNNPLTTIGLRAETLLTQVPPDDPKRRALQIIQGEVERMAWLVANLLQFSRRGAPQISTLDMREEIARTLELVHYHLRKHQISVTQDFAPDAPLIQADRQQLRQVFLNLFTNAADAMPAGGHLTIRIRLEKTAVLGLLPAHQPQATESLGLPIAPPPYVVIEISDTGEGIPMDIRAKVWETFYTTKPEGRGTGLGLAICRRIVQEHGGLIELVSAGVPGQGTTARITLPVAKGE